MNTLEFLTQNPEAAKHVKLEVTGADLLSFADTLHKNAMEAGKTTPQRNEEYLTSAEMAEALKISLVTLWSWDKKGITIPLKIGNQKRYRRSDLEKFLNQG